MAKKPKKLDEISKKFGAEREKALNDALKLIEKDFGKGCNPTFFLRLRNCMKGNRRLTR